MYQITYVTKLRNFQYRLLLNKVITNQDLYYWNLKNSPVCNFCKSENEDIIHCLIECQFSKQLWTYFFEFLTNLCIEYNGDVKSIMLNRIHNKTNHVVNRCCLLLKQFIYRKRCQNKIPYYEQFVVEIEIQHNIERAYAKVKNKINTYSQRWGPIVQLDE